MAKSCSLIFLMSAVVGCLPSLAEEGGDPLAIICRATPPSRMMAFERRPAPPVLSGSFYALARPMRDRLWMSGEGGMLLLPGAVGRAWWGPAGTPASWLLDVAFGDPGHGWSVGASGAVWRTEDAGLTWVEKDPGVANNLHAVWPSGPSELWVGGSDGMILHTFDGGESWQVQRLGYDGVIRRFFFDADAGWAVGDHGMILETRDRGATWNRLAADAVSTRANLFGVTFLDPMRGYAWGDFGTLLETDDAGRHWRALELDTNHSLRDLFFPPAGPAIALARRAVLALDGLDAASRESGRARIGEQLAWTAGVFHRGLGLEDGSVLAIGSRGLVARVTWIPQLRPEAVVGGLSADRLFGQAGDRAGAPASKARGFADRAGSFLGSRYRRDPLGEGPDGDIDRDPRLDVEGFDCVTLIEHALAFEVAGGDAGEEEFLPVLDKIRYRAGEVDFRTRNHFFVADWIPQNSWLVEDVTSSVGGDVTELLTRRMGRRSFFRSRQIEGIDGLEDEDRSTWVIPASAVPAVVDRLEDGMIVVLIGRLDWLFARHTGLLVAKSEGSGWLMRHASTSAGVVDQDFLAYLKGAGRSLRGVKLLRIVE